MTPDVGDRWRRTRRVVVALAWLAVLCCAAAAVAQGDARGETRERETNRRESEPLDAPEPDGATAWWRHMLSAEGRYIFDDAPVERSSLPGGAPALEGFVWPVGASPERVAAAFELQLVERTRVGDRAAVVLQASPRHDGVTWTFWVDVDTGARLAYQASLPSGRVVAEGRVEGAPRPIAASRSALPAPREPTPEQAARWRNAFGGLPGFDAIDVSRIALDGDVPALRVTLWDGLSAVVLLVFQGRARSPGRELVATRVVGDLTIALVGPLEPGVASAYLDHLMTRPWARTGWDTLIATLSGR